MNNNFVIDKFNQYNLPFGAKYSTCPICSEHRKKSRQKCMSLDWDTGIGTCHHCSSVIQLHTYKRSNDNLRSNKTLSVKQVLKKNYASLINANHKNHVGRNEPMRNKVTYCNKDIFIKSLSHYDKNNFVKYLHSLFGEKKTKELIKKYNVGTSKHWDGATVFWQQDKDKNVRTGKIILYDANSGKRIKEPFNHISWVHSVLKRNNFNLNQCFFGEHLLNEHKNIAIVESEKTAIISSAYLPQFNWLATGGLSMLTAEKCSVLLGKTVVLYPDVDAHEKWIEKAKEIEKQIHVKFIVSDILVKKATPKELSGKCDIADFLIRKKWVEKISKEQQALDMMINKNANLKTMIDKLNLVLIEN